MIWTIQAINRTPSFQPSTSQLEVLMRADVLFKGSRGGRHYAGVLTRAEVFALTDGVELKAETSAMIEALR